MWLVVLQAPNFNALTLVSLVAAVMSLSYSTIGFGMSLNSGLEQRNAPYNLDGYTSAEGIFGAFNALGTVAFAYGESTRDLVSVSSHRGQSELESTLPACPAMQLLPGLTHLLRMLVSVPLCLSYSQLLMDQLSSLPVWMTGSLCI